jgi:uncharacterized protein
VMGGALLVTFIGYRLVLPRKAPLFDSSFHLPTSKLIDARLVGGAAIFGLGWGISGFCPGGALPALGVFHPQVWIFVAAMVAGMMITRALGGKAH